MKKIIISETQLKKVVDKVLNEQSDLTNYNFNKAVQSFLIKKKITDSNNQPVKKDGSIGTLAKNSKSAQAIAKYQSIIGVEPDGVFGYDTMEKMKTKFPNDYKLWLQCKSEEGDLFDKGAHLLGLDEEDDDESPFNSGNPIFDKIEKNFYTLFNKAARNLNKEELSSLKKTIISMFEQEWDL